MTRKQFISIMEEFIVRRRDYLEWIDGIEDTLGGAWEPIMEHSFENLLIRAIGDALGGDANDWLGYFVYEKECEWFTYWDGADIEVEIDSFDKLYDLIKWGYIK